jgi:hypothetical protein
MYTACPKTPAACEVTITVQVVGIVGIVGVAGAGAQPANRTIKPTISIKKNIFLFIFYTSIILNIYK